MINTRKIKEYISLGDSPGFYGYGKWSSAIYVIGIEEAGGYSESLISQKIDQYYHLNNGNQGLFDNKLFQYNLTDPDDPKLHTYSDFFDGQITKLGYVSKIANLLKRLEFSTCSTIDYVTQNFGRNQSNHALIELFPLPCPKETDWRYPAWVDLPAVNFMSTKHNYRNEVLQKRLYFIRKKINESKKKKLILFLANGRSKIGYWDSISPVPINTYAGLLLGEIPYHLSDNKMYVVLPFPGSHNSNGIFNSYLEIENVANAINLVYSRI